MAIKPKAVSMNNFILKLKLLNEAIEKKVGVLNQILSLTENQQTVLEVPADREQADIFFKEMNNQKQILIDEVINLDKVFQSIYQEIESVFETEAQNNRDAVKELQDRIKNAMDLDIKIRVQEDKNKSLSLTRTALTKTAKTTDLKKPTIASKNYIIGKYAKNNRH